MHIEKYTSKRAKQQEFEKQQQENSYNKSS